MALIHARSTDKFKEDASTNIVEEVRSVRGAYHIASVGVVGTVYTQTLPTVTGTRQRMTFDPPIRSVFIDARGGAGTIDPDEALLVCFDAPTTTVADAWLIETNIAPRHAIKPNIGPREFYFNGDSVTYIDMLSVGTTPDLDVTAEGIV